MKFPRSLPCLDVEKDEEDGGNGWQLLCIAVGKFKMKRLPSTSFGG